MDLERIRALLQLFSEMTGLASAVVDVSGDILRTRDGAMVGAGWKRVCLDFHRAHPGTAKGCTESDVVISQTVNAGGAACYTCLNGLVDAASPVVVGGHHVANLFLGQFFHEPPDLDLFRTRAKQFGFDEGKYLKAVAEVPVYSREHVGQALAFLDMLAGILAEMGMKRQELLGLNQKIEGKVRERTAALTEANAQLARREAELARVNERLTVIDRAKTELFSNVSHEFRTPLTLVVGPVNRILATGPNLSGEQRRDLEVVRKNAYTLLKHVNDLLDATKLDAGRVELVYSACDLVEIIQQAAGNFEVLAADLDVKFTVQSPERLAAQVDVDKVERIVLNLLSNAFKFTPRGGRVLCTIEQQGDGHALIRVEDNGPGIPPEQRERVFERFRQGQADSVQRFGGTGLGLAIARDFAMLHGGIVRVVDGDGGATFEVVLPLVAPDGVRVGLAATSRPEPLVPGGGLADPPAPLEPASQDAEACPGGDRPVALVVEDNAELRRFIVRTLCGDFDIVTAGDGEEGYGKAVALRPDIIVTDLMMPRMSGDRMIAAIRAAEGLEDTPILVLSAKADDQLRINLLTTGAQDYITKPFLEGELRARATNLYAVKRAGDILRAELQSRERSLDTLAQAMTQQNRALKTLSAELSVARDQAEQASRAKSRFLAMVSHELRSPLQNFELYIALLKGAEGAASNGHLIGSLEAASARMTQIVTTILQHSSIEEGKVAITPSPVDIDVMIAEVAAEVEVRARSKGLSFVAEHRALRRPPLVTDPNLLRLILVNLLDNAVKYTERGWVSIASDAGPGGYRFIVADTGIGIPAEDQERIFEPFQQLEPVAHKHRPGVGLGLALVRKVVGTLGGRIDLRSAPESGSTFTVMIPSSVEEVHATPLDR
ncbi:ATP-binding protein [Azospirillum sp. sgz301742]